MLTIHYLSLVLAVIGVVLYLAVSDGKVAEVGRLLFAVALLAFLLAH